MSNRLLKFALHYASQGIPVLPLQSVSFPGGKPQCSCRSWRTCEDAGKHPRTRNGVLDATTDEKQILNWWSNYPNANIGIATGKKSGIFVLDVDIKHGGQFHLAELQDSYGDIGGTLTARTGSGGWHYFFKYLAGLTVRCSSSEIAPGLDIKGENGYVVAYPSLHKSGKIYDWHGTKTPILDAPDWLIYLIAKADEKNQTETLNGQIKQTADVNRTGSNEILIKAGGRNVFLFKYACGLANSYSKEEVKRLIKEKYDSCCEKVPDFKESEFDKIVKSAFKYHRQSQRTNFAR